MAGLQIDFRGLRLLWRGPQSPRMAHSPEITGGALATSLVDVADEQATDVDKKTDKAAEGGMKLLDSFRVCSLLPHRALLRSHSVEKGASSPSNCGFSGRKHGAPLIGAPSSRPISRTSQGA